MQKDKINLLLKIEYRQTGIDTVNASRLIYFNALYAIFLVFSGIFTYLTINSFILTVAFLIGFSVYLFASYRLYDYYQGFMKSIKLFSLSKETIDALNHGRKTLRMQLEEAIL